jgi:hypothetical protein
MRCPDTLKTARERRKWLERELPLSSEIQRSEAYRALSDNTKIILMLMLHKNRRHGRGR